MVFSFDACSLHVFFEPLLCSIQRVKVWSASVDRNASLQCLLACRVNSWVQLEAV